MRARTTNPEPACNKLRILSVELRSIAYLIQTQKFNDAPPWDLEEVHWGTGLLLEKMAKKIRKISNELELGQCDRGKVPK